MGMVYVAIGAVMAVGFLDEICDKMYAVANVKFTNKSLGMLLLMLLNMIIMLVFAIPGIATDVIRWVGRMIAKLFAHIVGVNYVIK